MQSGDSLATPRQRLAVAVQRGKDTASIIGTMGLLADLLSSFVCVFCFIACFYLFLYLLLDILYLDIATILLLIIITNKHTTYKVYSEKKENKED